MIRNLMVFLSSCLLAIFAILGTRMLWYRWALEDRSFSSGLGVVEGLYVVAWLPTFVVSFVVAILLAWALRSSKPALWTAALGIVIAAVRYSQTSHTFFGQPSLGSLVGIYGVYVVPVLGAVLGAYAARWLASRVPHAAEG